MYVFLHHCCVAKRSC